MTFIPSFCKDFPFALELHLQTAIIARMPAESINLTEKQAQFIRQSIDEGRYCDPSEVVRAGLRLLEQHERQDKLKIETLRRIAHEAFDEIDRGDFEMVDPDCLDEFMNQMDAKSHGARSQ